MMKKLLASVAAVGLLAGCATAGGGFNPSTVAFYAEDIEDGVTAILASPTIQADLTPADFANVSAAVNQIEATTKLLEVASGGISQATALGYVQQIESDTNIVISTVSAVKTLPPEAITVMTAIEVIEPIILASVQAATTPPAPAPAAKATVSGMTPAQAHTILSAKPVVP